MSKNKEKVSINPFDAFDILKGEMVNPDSSKDEQDDIETGTPDLIDEDANEEDQNEDSLKAGDELLKKVIDKQSKANSNVEEDEDDSVETDESHDEDTQTTNGYLDAIKDLSEKGILDINPEEIEDSEDGFHKAVEQTVNNKIKKHISGLGEEALDFLAFVENGGNPRDFVTTYYNEQSWDTYNLESESSQKVAIRESLRLAGETPEDIEDLVSEFEENGTLEKRAKSALVKLQKFEKEQKLQLVESQKQRAEAEKQANIKYWNDFKSDLDKREDIKGFKVTPKVKENLWSFMTVTDKTGKTAYQKAVEENQDSSLLFAYLAMNNFDISKLEKQVASKAASKVAGLLKNYEKSSKDRISSGRTYVDKDGEDPFAGFQTIK